MSILKVDTINEKTSGNGVIIPSHIVQVKQTVVTSTISSSAGNSYAEMTEFRTNITPSSTSSKILIRASLIVGINYYQGKGRILRDSTPIAQGDARGSRPQSTWTMVSYDAGASGAYTQYDMRAVGFEFLDSPATTSQITYSLDLGGYSTSLAVHINRAANDQDSANYNATPISTLTLMEIA
tara:strand:+ start:471 stop:1016 length:546 start_codon:yes stop_codon:yes gene_type:complete